MIYQFSFHLNYFRNIDDFVREKLTTHLEGIRVLAEGEEELSKILSINSSSDENSSAEKDNKFTEQLMKLLIKLKTLKAERTNIERKLNSTNPSMKTIFIQAAKNGRINESLISSQHLSETFGPLKQQV